MTKTINIYNQRYYPELSFLISIILMIFTLFVNSEAGLVIAFISLLFILDGIYNKARSTTYEINNGLIKKSKFIVSSEKVNKFANCIEYDILKNKGLFGVLFKTTVIVFRIKIRRGINNISLEEHLFELEDVYVENFIKEFSKFLDSVKVKI